MSILGIIFYSFMCMLLVFGLLDVYERNKHIEPDYKCTSIHYYYPRRYSLLIRFLFRTLSFIIICVFFFIFLVVLVFLMSVKINRNGDFKFFVIGFFASMIFTLALFFLSFKYKLQSKIKHIEVTRSGVSIVSNSGTAKTFDADSYSGCKTDLFAFKMFFMTKEGVYSYAKLDYIDRKSRIALSNDLASLRETGELVLTPDYQFRDFSYYYKKTTNQRAPEAEKVTDEVSESPVINRVEDAPEVREEIKTELYKYRIYIRDTYISDIVTKLKDYSEADPYEHRYDFDCQYVPGSSWLYTEFSITSAAEYNDVFWYCLKTLIRLSELKKEIFIYSEQKLNPIVIEVSAECATDNSCIGITKGIKYRYCVSDNSEEELESLDICFDIKAYIKDKYHLDM